MRPRAPRPFVVPRLAVALLWLATLGACSRWDQSLLGPYPLVFADWLELPDAVRLEPTTDLRMVVGEDRHFTAFLMRADFTRLEWSADGLTRPPGATRFLGFACVPADACGIESVTTNAQGRHVAQLRLHGATQAVLRIAAVAPGYTGVSVVAYTRGPCPRDMPQAEPDCEFHAEDNAFFWIDP